jgi:hypothetical protein
MRVDFLSLLAVAAERMPIVCVIDDAHLMDAESLESLAFVARRLSAESAILLLACRDDETSDRALAGLPELRLGGLDPSSAVSLLTTRVSGHLDPYLATLIVEQSFGNPLVLCDLAGELTATELEALAVSPDPMPLGPPR